MSKELTTIVNKQVANFSVMYIKLHNYHWYVKGEQFFTLHEKFEELYTETATVIDDLAERLLALGGSPVATMKEILEMSAIEEAHGNETAKDMVSELVKDFTTLTTELKQGMDVAGEVDDETTGDMLLAIHQSLEKHMWMLNSFLGK
ncbi:DNA starvation/stationary phase protection protein [Priestia aryabhattai]|uniref:Dps family protein n=1 Tax=Bacillaceae TaxID=186817 RepID=UPI000BA07C10|nr:MULTISPECIES: Dps family protein [Bacillaceae]MDT2045118.1 DNA starvation/stationary phase protection protein [Priestia flexa]OZT12302.1 DNA starvation/stationary phase protection protein [Priestia aryabhattai]TDB51122.1 DNA starvation/stationary phase protection protein [Bacillus sp. CBEL-1]USY54799.1 DNA starvation/stationary phase protection protein [Bacillus sp. 1780r2a1]